MEQMAKEGEQALFDAGLAVMDRARAEAQRMHGLKLGGDPNQATMVATQLAVQAIFQGEIAAGARKGEETFVHLDSRAVQSRFFGLGSGVGICLASSAGNPLAIIEALAAIEAGMSSAFAARSGPAAEAYRAFRKNGGGDRG